MQIETIKSLLLRKPMVSHSFQESADYFWWSDLRANSVAYNYQEPDITNKTDLASISVCFISSWLIFKAVSLTFVDNLKEILLLILLSLLEIMSPQPRLKHIACLQPIGCYISPIISILILTTIKINLQISVISYTRWVGVPFLWLWIQFCEQMR